MKAPCSKFKVQGSRFKVFGLLLLLGFSALAFGNPFAGAPVPPSPAPPAPELRSAVPALPPTALLITVLVPLLLAAAKKLFPELPGTVLPVLAPVLGAALEFALSRLGLDGGGTLTGAVAGGAGVGLREVVDQSKKLGGPPPGAVALLLLLLLPLSLCAGCTNFAVDQSDASPERTISFKLRGTAWFSGHQAIASLKAQQTDKTQSFGSTGLNQHGPTNAVAVIQATTKLIEAANPR